MSNDVDTKWCPTQAGTFTAYKPEWRDKNGEWKDIPIVRLTPRQGYGIPRPRFGASDVAAAIYLHGYEEALALAWQYAAYEAAEGNKVDVRVQSYEVVYDIKARKIESPER